MFSIVSTVSKSFPDLLSFWTRWESRDDNSDIRRSTTTGPEQKNSRASSPLSRWTPIPKSDDATSKVDEHDKKLNHAGWKSETVLADVEAKNSFTRAVASSGPPAETVSLLSFRSSNRNIDYLTRNEHTVSTQSVCQQETQAKEKTDIRHNDDNAGTRRKKTDRHSVVSDSRMLKKSPTFDSPTLNTRRIYKNKALKDSDERFSARRKHFKPKSESDNEMALAKKPINTRATNSATKGIENDATTSAIERHRPLSVSQQSLVAYDDENVFTENVRSERSLSLPAGMCVIYFD